MNSNLRRSMRCQSRVLPAVSLLAMAACAASPTGGADADDVIFLTASAPATVHMQALYEGNVVADAAGCLRLADASGHTVVWPHAFELRQRNGAATVVAPGGREIGEVGGAFRFGGGEVPTLHEGVAVSDAQRELALQRCPGRYWIVGEIP